MGMARGGHGMGQEADTQHPLYPSQHPGTHLASGRGSVPDLLCQPGQRADQQALPVKLLAQPLPAAAQQRCQQVLVPNAELGVLEAILQQPARRHAGSGQARGPPGAPRAPQTHQKK